MDMAAAGRMRGSLDDDQLGMGRVVSATGSEDEEGDLRRGPWTVEEDVLLVNYVANHGDGRWNSLARSAGLKRTGKSCRLRWLNYLRPDVRRGNITPEEQLLILELHSRWGNRWSRIAQHLPGRTDNEIKNYWRTRVQKHAKRLRCDVNSKRFRDVVRYVWMPRLVERIQAGESSSSSEAAAAADDAFPAGTAGDNNGAAATTVSAPASCQTTSAYSHHHHKNNNHMDYYYYYNEPSQTTAAAAAMSPDDTSSAPRSSSLTTEASPAHHLASTTTTNEGGAVVQQCGGATTAGPVDGDDVVQDDEDNVFGGSWSELLLAASGRDDDDDSMIVGLPDLEFGDFEDNLWSLEDLCLHQRCN